MKAIQSLEIDNGYLAKARDLFVFQMYTGLAYADLRLFDFKDYTLQNGVYVYVVQKSVPDKIRGFRIPFRKLDTEFARIFLYPFHERLDKRQVRKIQFDKIVPVFVCG